MAKQKEKHKKNQEEPIKRHGFINDFANIALFFLFTMILFRGIFSATDMIQSSDYSPWIPKMYKEELLSGHWQKWISFVFAGQDFQALFLYPSLVYLITLPVHFFIGWDYAFDIFLAGTFTYSFFRYLKIDRFPAFLSALGFMFSTHLVSEVYPGHMGKLDLFCWTPLVFLFYTKGFRENKWYCFVLAGVFYGLQFLAGEVQIAYYIGLCLAIHTIFLLVEKVKIVGRDYKKIGFVLCGSVITVLITILLSAQVFQFFLGLAAPGEGEPAGATDTASQYEFATSWSFPPEEIITLFMERPFGNITGDGYWGRIGSKQMTLKLNDDYIGVIPFLFVLIGLVFVERKKTLYWLVIAIATIILAFGGYTPLYKWVYHFPAMSSFRAPTKWTFICVFCVSILAGYGAGYLYSREKTPQNSLKEKWFLAGLACLCILSLVLAILGEFLSNSIVSQVTSYLQNEQSAIDYSTAYIRYEMILKSLWRMNVFLWLSSALIFASFKVKEWNKTRNYVFSVLGLILIVDLWSSGSYFIQYYPYQQYYEAHPVTQFLLNDPEYPRIKLGPQNGLLNNLSSMQFKYYQILCWDNPASRLPVHYKRFTEEVIKRDFMKFLDVVSIKYLLSAQLFRDPNFQPVFNNSGVYVYQYVNYVPHVYGIGKFIYSQNDDTTLQVLASPQFNVRDTLLLSDAPESGIVSSTQPEYTTQGFKFTDYTNDEVDISSQTDKDLFLVLTDYHFPNWHAYIDDKETKIYRANYLVRAIWLPKGEHRVKFTYNPPMPGLYITLAMWIIILISIIVYGIRWFKLRKKTA